MLQVDFGRRKEHSLEGAPSLLNAPNLQHTCPQCCRITVVIAAACSLLLFYLPLQDATSSSSSSASPSSSSALTHGWLCFNTTNTIAPLGNGCDGRRRCEIRWMLLPVLRLHWRWFYLPSEHSELAGAVVDQRRHCN